MSTDPDFLLSLTVKDLTAWAQKLTEEEVVKRVTNWVIPASATLGTAVVGAYLHYRLTRNAEAQQKLLEFKPCEDECPVNVVSELQSVGGPLNIIIIGKENSGKSAFVNTLLTAFSSADAPPRTDAFVDSEFSTNVAAEYRLPNSDIHLIDLPAEDQDQIFQQHAQKTNYGLIYVLDEVNEDHFKVTQEARSQMKYSPPMFAVITKLDCVGDIFQSSEVAQKFSDSRKQLRVPLYPVQCYTVHDFVRNKTIDLLALIALKRVVAQINHFEKTVPYSESCAVCMTNPATYCTIPCGHRTYCYECVQQLDKCAVCRQHVEDVLRVFV